MDLSIPQVQNALRDALSTSPWLPLPPSEARKWLVDRAVVVNQIAQALGLGDVAGEALELIDICDKHQQREAKTR